MTLPVLSINMTLPVLSQNFQLHNPSAFKGHLSTNCRLDARLPLCEHFKSRSPNANVPCRNEIVATDIFFSHIPAHDDVISGHGDATMVQLYCGTSSLLTAIFPMKKESEMPGNLPNFIPKLGAPNTSLVTAQFLVYLPWV
jgi:hypothetical protein